MKKSKIILLFLASLLITNLSVAQNNDRNFGVILESYYLFKDKDILEKTVDFVNKTKMSYPDLEPILTGFFGALFGADPIVKNKFYSNLDKFANADVRKLFSSLNSSNIDTIYKNAKLSPAFNDMNWSSYYATGSTKYLDNIISNLPYCENRTDLNLFLTGASAKWSLCSNATQDEQVKKYLTASRNNNKAIDELLQRDPESFKAEMVDIIKKQRAKGIWN